MSHAGFEHAIITEIIAQALERFGFRAIRQCWRRLCAR